MKSNMLMLPLLVICCGLAIPSQAVEKKPAQAPAKAAETKPVKTMTHRMWATVESLDMAARKLVVLQRDGKTLELALPEGIQASKGKNQSVALTELRKGDRVLLTMEGQTLKRIHVGVSSVKAPASHKKAATP